MFQNEPCVGNDRSGPDIRLGLTGSEIHSKHILWKNPIDQTFYAQIASLNLALLMNLNIFDFTEWFTDLKINELLNFTILGNDFEKQ